MAYLESFRSNVDDNSAYVAKASAIIYTDDRERLVGAVEGGEQQA